MKGKKEMKTVWMIKGLAAGLFAFFLFTFFYFNHYLGPWTSNKAVSLSVPKALFLHRPLYWVASVLIVLVACMIAKLFHSVR